MITLYPVTKKFHVLIIALCIINTVSAQQFAYVAADVKAEKRSPEEVVKIKTRSQNKVLLNWESLGEDISHYVIERSVNGRSFYEAGVFFTGESGENPDYVFIDHLQMNYTGTLYYRLHVFGLDGSEIFTPVTKVSGGMSLLTH